MFLKKQETGVLGEDIAVKFLKNKGFSIVCRNYRKKWGEIDIVAEKDKVIHFVEVKTLAYSKTEKTTSNIDFYEAEERVDYRKRIRFARIIEIYLSEYNKEESDFFVDVCAVYIDKNSGAHEIKFIEDVELV